MGKWITFESPKLGEPQPSPCPYIGGVGGSISLVATKNGIAIKPSIGTVFSELTYMLLTGPGLITLAIVKYAELSRHPLHLAMLSIVSLSGWFFGMRALSHAISGRRVEICGADGSVSLIRNGSFADARIEKSDIVRFEILETTNFNRHRGYRVGSNFTLRLHTNEGKAFDLCTSSQKSEIEKTRSAIEGAGR